MIDLNKNRRRFDFFFSKKTAVKLPAYLPLKQDMVIDLKIENLFCQREKQRERFLCRDESGFGGLLKEREREGEGFVEKARHRNCRFPTCLFQQVTAFCRWRDHVHALLWRFMCGFTLLPPLGALPIMGCCCQCASNLQGETERKVFLWAQA